jgi:hypothetical protein
MIIAVAGENKEQRKFVADVLEEEISKNGTTVIRMSFFAKAREKLGWILGKKPEELEDEKYAEKIERFEYLVITELYGGYFATMVWEDIHEYSNDDIIIIDDLRHTQEQDELESTKHEVYIIQVGGDDFKFECIQTGCQEYLVAENETTENIIEYLEDLIEESC